MELLTVEISQKLNLIQNLSTLGSMCSKVVECLEKLHTRMNTINSKTKNQSNEKTI